MAWHYEKLVAIMNKLEINRNLSLPGDMSVVILQVQWPEN